MRYYIRYLNIYLTLFYLSISQIKIRWNLISYILRFNFINRFTTTKKQKNREFVYFLFLFFVQIDVINGLLYNNR